MTLDEYAAWAAEVGVVRYGRMPKGVALRELALGFVSEVGEVAGVLAKWLRDGEPLTHRLVDELGDVAYYWARLSLVSGLTPSALLARSRAHVDWRRAGRPAGGPPPATAPLSLEEFTTWVGGVHGASRSTPSCGSDLWDIGLALAGDAGEVVDCIRRLEAGDDGQRDVLAAELGDVWRYWTCLCVGASTSPATLLARSRTKIEGRLARPRCAAPRSGDEGARLAERPRPGTRAP